MQYNVVSYFDKLKKSKFRSSFKLSQNDYLYIEKKGIMTISLHAKEFISVRLSPANPKNDGKQTPFKNHPVFIAQHATATCCRTCLNKWYGISKGQILSVQQVDFCIELIMTWIAIQLDLFSSS
jgi:hypothetical protein|tara:strand:+ start:776 stop:1147 length:372 start_codon:yes stop_codon:yes gene_type:complete